MSATVAEYSRPWMYGKQRDALFARERYALVEATTKSGKTVGCIVWLFEQAALNGAPGRHYWWVAPTLGVSAIAYRRMKAAIPRSLYTHNETDRTITLANGAMLWFKGADKPDTLYGEDVYAAVIDEASRCKEESWHAVRTTLTATRGPIRIIGNVKGRQNWAYNLARMAEQGAPDMHYARLTAYDAVEGGILRTSDVDDARRVLPDHVFRELYLAEPSDDGGNPFGLDKITACLSPLSRNPVAVWGVDLARAVDYTVAIGLDVWGHTAALERWQLPWAITKSKLGELLRNVPCVADATGVGDAIVQDLQAMPDLQVTGFKFTAPSKLTLMQRLIAAVQAERIRFPDGIVRQEMESFEYDVTASGVRYAAPDGLHDDAVIALALAVHGYDMLGLAPPVEPEVWLGQDPVRDPFEWARTQSRFAVIEGNQFPENY